MLRFLKQHGLVFAALLCPLLYGDVLIIWMNAAGVETFHQPAADLRMLANFLLFCLFHGTAVCFIILYVALRLFRRETHAGSLFPTGLILLVLITVTMGWVNEFTVHNDGYILSTTLRLSVLVALAYVIYFYFLFRVRKHMEERDEPLENAIPV